MGVLEQRGLLIPYCRQRRGAEPSIVLDFSRLRSLIEQPDRGEGDPHPSR